MHVSDPRAVALPAVVAEALAQAAAVYTEVEGGLGAATALFTAGSLPPAHSLRELLPVGLHRRLVGYLEARHMSATEFETFKPWLATVMLAQLDAQEFLRHGSPLDDVLRQRAAAGGKFLGAVETVAEQIAAISVGTEADQIHLLDVALARLEADRAAGRNRLRSLFDTWLRGDAGGLLRLRDEDVDLTDPAQRQWWDALFVQRNLRMADRTDRILRESRDQPAFFAFGTLHFVGEGSVVELLQARGWKVERILGQR
jgi:uncharacterized protein YbaP (TraB family)